MKFTNHSDMCEGVLSDTTSVGSFFLTYDNYLLYI